jgi:hypothetical protein
VNWRERETEAAATLRECREALAARGSTVIGEATGIREATVLCEATGKGAADIDAGIVAGIVDWRHYPEGEVCDPASHAQYFYHRHPGRHPGPARVRPAEKPGAKPAEKPGAKIEHGHFHLFLRGEGVPAGITPLLLPELAVANAPAPRQSAPLKRGGSDEVCHLVALAVDRCGDPIRLFTTNRWVTGETWYRADDVILMLDRFRVAGNHPSALLNRWIGALVHLFQPEIAALLRERDKAILEQRWRRRGNVLEDLRLEITSSLDVDLDVRLAAVEHRTDGSAAANGTGRAPRLPRMAEGWGR